MNDGEKHLNKQQKQNGYLEQLSLFLMVLFYALFAWHRWWSGVSPRLIRGSAERDAIHHAHLSIGSTLFVIVIPVSYTHLTLPTIYSV